MQLQAFNAAPAAQAAAEARVWADIPAWVDALVAGRPYEDVDEVAAEAGLLSADWDAADLDRALAHHPRIGDRPAGEGAEAAASRREQGAMSSAPDAVAGAIADGNAVYEERFGRVFLVRAAGRTPEEILAELRRRLDNDPEDEVGEALEQLAEIAVLRLRADLADPAGETS